VTDGGCLDIDDFLMEAGRAQQKRLYPSRAPREQQLVRDGQARAAVTTRSKSEVAWSCGASTRATREALGKIRRAETMMGGNIQREASALSKQETGS